MKAINNFLGSKTTYGNVLDVVNLVNTLKDSKEDVELIDTKTWKPFKVKNIFKNIEKGSVLMLLLWQMELASLMSEQNGRIMAL